MKRNHINIIKEIAIAMFKHGTNDRYLELGIHKAKCFNVIAPLFKLAIGVDTNKKWASYINPGPIFFNSSTDNYFLNLYDGIQFDLTFIDANHNFPFVQKDFTNSYRTAKENSLIIMHDTYPPHFERMESCKDAYKAADWIKKSKHLFDGELVTLPFYFGLTIFRKCTKQLLWM